MSNKVLVVGGGGREHAIAWSLAKSPHLSEIIVAPGNAGTATATKCRNLHVDLHNLPEIVALAQEQEVSLVVVGPETPLVAGLIDALETAGIAAFGPSAAAAQLEGSKSFCKKFLQRNNIATAKATAFCDAQAALRHLETVPYVPVIKAAGLAAGKGVVVPKDKDAAAIAIQEMLVGNRFGAAGKEILIEERLYGDEVSVLAFCDGNNFTLMPIAQDYKRLLDGDKGPNTGGMGAFCPTPLVSNELARQIEQQIFAPTLAAMTRHGHPYKGVLYAGLMLTETGPKVIEFNCRFGDPETQVILALLKSDLYEIMLACCEGNLENVSISWAKRSAVSVVLASSGYPSQTSPTQPIVGIEKAMALGCNVFHAGTTVSEGSALATGGRVLAITATAKTITEAKRLAYSGVAAVNFEGMAYRLDIGEISE